MTPEPGADDAATPEVTSPSAELPRGWRAVGKGAGAVHTAGDEIDDDAVHFAGDRADDALDAPAAPTEEADGSMSNAALVGIGLFAGIYLLYTLGWYAGTERIAPVAPVLLMGDMVFLVLKWMAIAAPFVWFVVTFVLTRHAKTWKRFAWLVAGALLLAPWPLFANLTSEGAQ